MAGRFVLPGGGDITISGDAATRLMGAGSGDAALLYIYILSNGGRLNEQDAAAALTRSPAQVEAAMDVLCRLGLVELHGAAAGKLERPEELPDYSAQDIRREIENGGAFRALVDEVQSALGAQLSSQGLVTLFGIYDYLRLPPEVILTLVHYCSAQCQARSGPGRRPSMRYIEKTAYAWEREGIFSLEAAEAYIKRRDTLDAAQRDLAQVLGISGRALSATERRYIDSWTEMGFGAEALSMAYDRTVTKTGRLTWRYMDSIIKSWHSKNLHTPEEIEAGDAPPQYKKRPPEKIAPAQSGATARELEDMKATLRKIRGDDK